MIASGIGDRIKQARCAAGLGVRPFASALDEACSSSTVRRWERAKNSCSAPTLFYALRICAVCKISLEWLMYGERGAALSATEATGREVAERLKRRREELGVSRKELAETISTSPTKVRQWECESCQPSLFYIDKLSAALDMSVDELVGGGNA